MIFFIYLAHALFHAARVVTHAAQATVSRVMRMKYISSHRSIA
jgi:hypothetical protein